MKPSRQEKMSFTWKYQLLSIPTPHKVELPLPRRYWVHLNRKCWRVVVNARPYLWHGSLLRRRHLAMQGNTGSLLSHHAWCRTNISVSGLFVFSSVLSLCLQDLFFQEWQPLLPIVHRPTFLRIYEQYLAKPEASAWHTNKASIAQLYLIFDVAAQSTLTLRDKAGPTTFELQWRKALHAASSTPAVATLQCHVLAQLCFLMKGDHSHLLRHRAVGVGMCHQLGLHQGHRYHQFSTLESETRKKVFWCQYVLDKYVNSLLSCYTSLDFPHVYDCPTVLMQIIGLPQPSPALRCCFTTLISALSTQLTLTMKTLAPKVSLLLYRVS